MATRNKSHLPIPAHVQALIDALESLKPAHWTARHGDGSASGTWMIYSQVFRARIDDLKLAGEEGRQSYRVGLEVALEDGSLHTCFNLYDNPVAVRRFQANFRPELLRSMEDCLGPCDVTCGSRLLKERGMSNWVWQTGLPGRLIQQWLNSPAYCSQGRMALAVGLRVWSTAEEIAEWAPSLAAAYLPLLECMVPLEGEPLDPKRETRNARLRAKLAKVTGPAKQCSCEHRKIDGLDSRFACGGPLEGAHIKPYQKGGSDTADNGLWLCRVHHCETEGRIEGNRLSVRLLDHIPQQRFSRLAAC